MSKGYQMKGPYLAKTAILTDFTLRFRPDVKRVPNDRL
jgi:hypothetical protein